MAVTLMLLLWVARLGYNSGNAAHRKLTRHATALQALLESLRAKFEAKLKRAVKKPAESIEVLNKRIAVRPSMPCSRNDVRLALPAAVTNLYMLSSDDPRDKCLFLRRGGPASYCRYAPRAPTLAPPPPVSAPSTVCLS